MQICFRNIHWIISIHMQTVSCDTAGWQRKTKWTKRSQRVLSLSWSLLAKSPTLFPYNHTDKCPPSELTFPSLMTHLMGTVSSWTSVWVNPHGMSIKKSPHMLTSDGKEEPRSLAPPLFTLITLLSSDPECAKYSNGGLVKKKGRSLARVKEWGTLYHPTFCNQRSQNKPSENTNHVRKTLPI